MDKERLNLPFTGIASFFRAPICEDWSKINSDVAILGVPFDQSTAVRPGARYGPRGIREASSIFRIGEYYDFELDEKIFYPNPMMEIPKIRSLGSKLSYSNWNQ